MSERINKTKSEKDVKKALDALTSIVYKNPNLKPDAVAEAYYSETGIKLSASQVKDYLKQIKDATKGEGGLEEWVAEERIRLNVLEQALWDAFNVSKMDTKRRIIDEIAKRGDDGDIELVVNGIRTIKDFNPGDMKILQQIIDVQKERRKLLGVYAPARQDIKAEVEIVKGFVSVSPDDWDEE